MSATEKLAAWSETVAEYQRVVATEDADGVLAEPLPNKLLVEASLKIPHRLVAALPQLLALAKAAEEARPMPESVAEIRKAFRELDAALGDGQDVPFEEVEE